MICTLDRIKQDYIKSINEIFAFIDLIDLCKTQDFSFASKSKYYNAIITLTNPIKERLSTTTDAQYNAIIISLYGSFERTIKEATNTFIKHCINNKFQLASKLSIDYISSTLKALERRSLKENKSIIQDLHYFLNENDITRFNSDLSLHNYQNLRISVISTIASSVEMVNPFNSIKKTDDFLCYIQKRQGLSSKDQAKLYVDRIPNAFLYIDEIVNARNQIAHEGRSDSRYDNNTLKEFVIEEFRIFVCQYIELLKETWYKRCVQNNKMVKEINVLSIYNNQIICFNTGSTLINKKSIIIIKDGKNKCEIATIKQIQHNRNDVDYSELNQDIGCLLNKRCKDTFKYYLYSE